MCALALLLLAPRAHADDRAKVLEVRAERLAAAHRCDEVVALAAAAPGSARHDARLLRIVANCQIELGRYADAFDSARAAKQTDPELEDLDLLMGIALYHQGRLAEAGDALAAARGHTTREAELDLYTGLVLLQRSRTREAALALERARRSDPDAVEPAASYYAGLAWQAERERTRAEAALDRVRAADPGGPWAQQAERALRGEQPNRWWASVSAGVEYDDNVVLRSAGSPPTDEDDFRAVWFAEGGIRLLDRGDWSGGVLASYSGSAHFDLSDFDTHYPSAGIWLDYLVDDDTLLRTRYDFGYAWVDYDPFVLTQRVRESLLHGWAAGTTEVFVAGEWNDFRFNSPPGPPSVPSLLSLRDRDGAGIFAGVEHRLPVWNDRAQLRAGYTYMRYWADGTEWDYDSHRVHLGATALLAWDVSLDVEGAYAYQPHRDPTTFVPGAPPPPPLAGHDRRDHVWTAYAELEKPVAEHVTLATRYRYLHSNSNSIFFEYDRHIVGAYVTVEIP